ncbi:MAG: hypothetical protein R2695_21955 [Acidimicrobiales bacterium]
MPVTPAIVDDPAEVTAAWLTSVLARRRSPRHRHRHPREPVGTGQMAHNERYRFTFGGDADGCRRPSSSSSRHPAWRAGPPGRRGYRNEVRFYTDLADRLSVAVPACLYGPWPTTPRCSRWCSRTWPRPAGDQIGGADDEQILAAARNLAGLHAPRWGDPTLADLDWLQSSGGAAIGYVELVTPMFIDRYRDTLDDRARMVFEEFRRQGRQLDRANPGPRRSCTATTASTT